MNEPTAEPIVSYTLREVLARIESQSTAGFATLAAKLDNKADKGDVEALRHQISGKADKSDLDSMRERIDSHGRAIGELKDRQRDDEVASTAVQAADEKRRTWRQWAVGVAVIAAAAAPGFIALVH